MSRLIHAAERHALDLTLRHFERTMHGIVCIGTWHWFERIPRQCLVLLNAHRSIKAGRTVPIVIDIRDAWKWAAHGDVGDPDHCGYMTREWIKRGWLPGTPTNARDLLNVLDAVNNCLTDLINMPPAPRLDQRVVGEVTAIDRRTGRVTETEITNNV